VEHKPVAHGQLIDELRTSNVQLTRTQVRAPRPGGASICVGIFIYFSVFFIVFSFISIINNGSQRKRMYMSM